MQRRYYECLCYRKIKLRYSRNLYDTWDFNLHVYRSPPTGADLDMDFYRYQSICFSLWSLKMPIQWQWFLATVLKQSMYFVRIIILNSDDKNSNSWELCCTQSALYSWMRNVRIFIFGHICMHMIVKAKPTLICKRYNTVTSLNLASYIFSPISSGNSLIYMYEPDLYYCHQTKRNIYITNIHKSRVCQTGSDYIILLVYK